MTKLIIALAFTTLVAFASAHHPIITTTTTLIDDGNLNQQCSEQVAEHKFSQCQIYMSNNENTNDRCCTRFGCFDCLISSEGQQGPVEPCCGELHTVDAECQCEAMLEVYRRFGQQSRLELEPMVQNLLDQCNLPIKLCRIPSATMF